MKNHKMQENILFEEKFEDLVREGREQEAMLRDYFGDEEGLRDKPIF